MTTRETLDRAAIKDRTVFETSLMPEGLLNGLTDPQVRDLIAYLMRK
jgi:hypothetical protein